MRSEASAAGGVGEAAAVPAEATGAGSYLLVEETGRGAFGKCRSLPASMDLGDYVNERRALFCVDPRTLTRATRIGEEMPMRAVADRLEEDASFKFPITGPKTFDYFARREADAGQTFPAKDHRREWESCVQQDDRITCEDEVPLAHPSPRALLGWPQREQRGGDGDSDPPPPID